MKIISICVPIYGTEKYIERCARSLFVQDIENVEYIFVNDCTKDNSIRVLNQTIKDFPKLSSRVHIINHEKNLGLAGARLTGFKHASGDYIWCIDSDDYVEVNAISKIYSYVERNYDFIVFNYNVLTRNGVQKYNSKSLSISNLLSNKISPCIWKCVFKKELLVKNNIWPIVGINNSEDYLLTSRLIFVAKKRILLDDCYLYNYNLMNENSYTNKPNLKNLHDCVNCMFVVFQFYKERGALKKYHTALGYRMAMCYLNLIKLSPNDATALRLLKTIKETDIVIYCFLKYNVKGAFGFLKIYRKIF